MDSKNQYLEDIQRYHYENDQYDTNVYEITHSDRNYVNKNNGQIYSSEFEKAYDNLHQYDIDATDQKTKDYIRQNKTKRQKKINQKAERMKRTGGLLLRVILACTIFILLYFGNLFSIECNGYSTKRIIDEVQNNSLIEMLESKVRGWL